MHGIDDITLRSELSGLLVGAELAAAKPYWLGQNIAIIGGEAVSKPYITGLAAQGVVATHADGAEMTLAGIKAAYSLLETTT